VHLPFTAPLRLHLLHHPGVHLFHLLELHFLYLLGVRCKCIDTDNRICIFLDVHICIYIYICLHMHICIYLRIYTPPTWRSSSAQRHSSSEWSGYPLGVGLDDEWMPVLLHVTRHFSNGWDAWTSVTFLTYFQILMSGVSLTEPHQNSGLTDSVFISHGDTLIFWTNNIMILS